MAKPKEPHGTDSRDSRRPVGGGQIIPCGISPEKQRAIREYGKDLRAIAYTIGSHGLTKEQFEASGIFQAAIESIRGTKSATMLDKREFVRSVLEHLRDGGEISNWKSSGSRDRHDFEIQFPDGRTCVIETKGCLDGNNTNIFTRPPNADEFVIWSLCQNPGSNMSHNVWSGIHTRLGPEIISEHKQVDGLIVWDMLCGSDKRPCPKLAADPARAAELSLGNTVPPPCLYVFPRTIPDYRNNPCPRAWSLAEVRILDVLHRVFKGRDEEVVEVRFEAGHNGADITRVTRLLRNGVEIARSKADVVKRARG
ncbi:MAG: hypothetical protein ACLQU1_32140 [Bryobacteraceae bacterium]